MSDDNTDETVVETKTVTVEVPVDVRVPTDSDSYSFDPMAEELGTGELRSEWGGSSVSLKKTRVRNEARLDLLTEIEQVDSFEPLGVFLPASEVIRGAVRAVEKSDTVELPEGDA